jgi:hypothetical protein
MAFPIHILKFIKCSLSLLPFEHAVVPQTVALPFTQWSDLGIPEMDMKQKYLRQKEILF